MKTYNVQVTRISYSTISVEANSPEEAKETALNEVGAHEFSDDSDYEAHDVEEEEADDRLTRAERQEREDDDFENDAFNREAGYSG